MQIYVKWRLLSLLRTYLPPSSDRVARATDIIFERIPPRNVLSLAPQVDIQQPRLAYLAVGSSLKYFKVST